MATRFDQLDAALSASCITAFGEAATLRPRRASRFSDRAADPSRPEAPVSGVYSAGPGEESLKGKVIGGDFQGMTRFATMRAEFWVPAEVVASLPYPIAPGDLVILTDGNLPYEVVKTQPTDMGDVNLILAFDDIPAAQAGGTEEPAP